MSEAVDGLNGKPLHSRSLISTQIKNYAMQDPFIAVKEEVEHSLLVVNQLHAQWKELQNSSQKSDEFEWTSSELLSGLRSIEWDLQDLEDTVSIVESSRAKFQLDDGELQARKAFIYTTRQAINSMRDQVQGAQSASTPGYSMKSRSSPLPLSRGQGKGYGQLGSMDETEMGVLGAFTQPLPSADGDEILLADGVDSSSQRHRCKKMCCLLTPLLIAGVCGLCMSHPPL